MSVTDQERVIEAADEGPAAAAEPRSEPHPRPDPRARRRIVVAQPCGGGELVSARIPTGVVRWRERAPLLTIVVKLTLDHSSPDAVRIAAEQAPITPEDLVPRKAAADVLLAGHARAAAPATRIDIHLRVGALDRRFVAAARVPADRIPLTPHHLRDPGGHRRVRTAAAAAPRLPAPAHGPGFDHAVYNLAPPEQRCARIDPDAEVELAGLSPGGARAFRLPGLAPRVLVERPGLPPFEVQLTLDTLHFDADHDRATLTWRGACAAPAPGEPAIDHLAVALDRAGSPRPLRELRRALARPHVSLAVEPGQPSPEPQDAREAAAVTRTRHKLLAGDEPAVPQLSLADYARVSAELAEQRDLRAEVLARHELDEHGWLAEDRAWMETMGRAASEGNGATAARYGELYAAVQDALAAPGELDRTLKEYAEISAAMDVSDDPRALLEERSLTTPAWMRLDRRWSSAMEADPDLVHDFTRWKADAAASLAAPRPQGGGSR